MDDKAIYEWVIRTPAKLDWAEGQVDWKQIFPPTPLCNRLQCAHKKMSIDVASQLLFVTNWCRSQFGLARDIESVFLMTDLVIISPSDSKICFKQPSIWDCLSLLTMHEVEDIWFAIMWNCKIERNVNLSLWGWGKFYGQMKIWCSALHCLWGGPPARLLINPAKSLLWSLCQKLFDVLDLPLEFAHCR